MVKVALCLFAFSMLAVQLSACQGKTDASASSETIINNWTAAREKILRSVTVEFRTESIQVFWPETKSETTNFGLQFKMNDAGLLLMPPSAQGDNGPQGSQLSAKNRDYAFELGRQPAETKWFLRQIAKCSDENLRHPIIRAMEHTEIDFRWFPWEMPGNDGIMAKIMSGKLVVVSISIGDNIPDTLCLTASCEDFATEDGKRVPVRRTVRLTLDPKNNYLPLRYEDDYEKYQAITEFGDFRDVKGIRVPFASTIKWTPSGSSMTRKILSLSTAPISAKEFRLPAYGIIEPSFVKPNRPWLLYGVGLLSVVLATLTIFYWRSSHRRNA